MVSGMAAEPLPKCGRLYQQRASLDASFGNSTLIRLIVGYHSFQALPSTIGKRRLQSGDNALQVSLQRSGPGKLSWPKHWDIASSVMTKARRRGNGWRLRDRLARGLSRLNSPRTDLMSLWPGNCVESWFRYHGQHGSNPQVVL